MSDPPRWEVEGRGWPLAEHSRFVAAAGVRWHVQIMGDGPPLLLIHGTGAATHSWRDVAPLLARAYTVIVPDLPGHGFTAGRPPGGLALPAVARAVVALLAALEVAPGLIVGHSAGAAIALEMVTTGAAAPAGVVGFGAALQPFPGLSARLFPALAKLLFLNPFTPHILARVARTPGETGRFLERSTGSRIDARGVELYARLFGRAGHCAGAITLMAEWDLEPLVAALPHLAVPLLLVHGGNDRAVPADAARASAAAVPDGRLELLPGLGHLAHEERPDRAAGEIAGFARMLGISRGGER